MTCKHTSVARTVHPNTGEVWTCDNPHCKTRFVPDPGPVFNLTLDGIAGTMAAVLWDYQARMFEKFGLGPKEEENVVTRREDPCADGHKRDINGICLVCNDSPFL